MSTLEAARRDWIHRIASDPGYQDGAVYRAHQNEYILPVYEHTTVDELVSARPPDERRLVFAVLSEGRVRFGFHYWDFDAEPDPARPSAPGTETWIRGVQPRPVDGSMTIAEMYQDLDLNGVKGSMTIGEVVEQAIVDRERAREIKRARRKE